MDFVTRSPIQFAVVREDPRVERAVVDELRPRRILLTASGGCTALALRAWFPEADVHLVDPNPAQLAHVDAKREALRAFDPRRFNIGDDDAGGLHELGNFERLFRLWRRHLDLFVLGAEQRAALLTDVGLGVDDLLSHPYWAPGFDMAFSDGMLTAMFGPDAVQHAARGSYPGYFRARVEAGLRADDRPRNPWLHHLLLGRYFDEPSTCPPFLRERPERLDPWPVVKGTFDAVPSFAPYDLVQLSNVPDWLDDAACARLATRLARELRPGGAVLWRQLNDPRDLRGFFADAFAFDAARDARLLALDRSLFYDRIRCGVRR